MPTGVPVKFSAVEPSHCGMSTGPILLHIVGECAARMFVFTAAIRIPEVPLGRTVR